jgi:hypothetical protein
VAKFVTEDGKDSISGDAFMTQLMLDQSKEEIPYILRRKRHTDVEKLKHIVGTTNGHRINNINDYDLLIHIQQTLSLNGRCILEMITNEDHKCINNNETITRRIRQFAEKYMPDDFKETHPKTQVSYRISESEFGYRDETDKEWHDRLCHIYIHQFHPSKLQMIKCEECIQKWMNSDIW